MPELPEVETMVRGLRPALEGMTLLQATVRDGFLLEGVTAEEFERRAAGATVERVTRRGKWVVLVMASGRGVVVIQPRMTGGFWLVPPDRPEHVRLVFQVDGPTQHVWFCDSRRLGKIAWHADSEAAEATFHRSQGPDALEIAAEDLRNRLKGTDRPIKPALMDQKVLAGIGNIYADETLHRAGIHPERRSSSLTHAEVGRLHAAIGTVLQEAIRAEGSSFDAGYRTVLGLEGGFLATNAVYGRGGQPCPGCGGPITRARIVGLIGRSSHFCPTCQPASGRKSRRPQS